MRRTFFLVLIFILALFLSCDRVQSPTQPEVDSQLVENSQVDTLPPFALAKIEQQAKERARIVALTKRMLAKRDQRQPRAVAANLTVPGEYETIQDAVDAAFPGDKITIGDGDYYEHVTIMTNYIRLIPAHKGNVTLHGRLNIWWTTGVTIEGLRIDAEEWAGIDSYQNNYLTVIDNEVFNCPNTGIWLDAVSNSMIKNNKVHDNWAGIRTAGCNAVMIKSNEASGNFLGIYCTYSNGNGFKTNRCMWNEFNGLRLFDSNENYGWENVCNFNGDTPSGGSMAGLAFNHANDNVFRDTQANSNKSNGIYFSPWTNNNRLTDTQALYNDGAPWVDFGTGNIIQ